ncbi:MAG: AhpC/TSA family protein [Candidatus Dormibacteraeota bacterium]|nr:AhpC/TSA family protein [Candidatus Dormibacteraeota bacterium]
MAIIDGRALAGTTLLDTAGGSMRLGDLWETTPAVVVWLRHFGCLFCKEQTAEFRARRGEIEVRGARLAFVGNGGRRYATGFRDEFCSECTVLTDPELTSYKLIGARGGLVNTLGPQAWAAGIRAFRRGARQQKTQGHPFQQGGVLVVEAGGRVAYSYLSKAAGDHPRVNEVIAAIPAPATAAVAR